MATAPVRLLERILDQTVSLTLKDGRSLRGKLLGIDEHMNLVLDDVQETTAEATRRLGRVVLRGSNVISLNAPSGASTKTP